MTTETTPLMQVYLSVMGDFDPDEFTVRVGLTPTRTWRRGERSAVDARFAGRTVPVCDHWAFGLPEQPAFYLEPLVEEVLAETAGQLKVLGQAVTDLGLNLELVVVAKWDPATTSSPSLHLNGQQMALLGAIGAALDIDLYADP
ncbi:DUF4279 domain-containing protein [Deinococcus aquaedulcis]|uniref:DUF4279 domain-containing protein n=1 Tax=Deinococcus aquaedulcis TaxID=2840455 RepID=UPI001C83902F|nr:DUF4279 domain-containing protein [Deinococcus aquaedulcis]